MDFINIAKQRHSVRSYTSAIVGTWFAFFNPGIGVVMSVSIIGAAIIYLLSKGKDR